MLLERAAALSAKIGQYHMLKGTADESARFKTRADQLGGVAERLGATRSALADFAKAGIPVPFGPSDPRLIERTRTLRGAIEQDPHVIDEPPFDMKHEFLDRLASLSKAAAEAMLRAWQIHVRHISPNQSDDVLSALAGVPQFRQGINKIRRARTEVQAIAATLPDDLATAVQRIEALAEVQRSAWAELSADGIPGPVIAFLKASSSDGAPLSQLTAEVREWLETRDLLGVFRILIR